MQKKALVLALFSTAALPLTAHADSSNVTLYGRMNVSVESTKIEDSRRITEVVDNNSRIGFRGKEDLGDGMAAVFQIESRIKADTGGTTLGSRDTWVGLTGPFGEVRMGRMTSPTYYATVDYVSMHNHDTGNSSDALFDTNVSPYANVRNDNTVYYATPSINGFKLETAYSFLTESTNKPHEVEAVVSYDAGPLHAGLGGGETRDFDANAGADAVGRRDRGIIGAVVYDFGLFTLAGLAEHAKTDLPNNGSFTRNYYRLSAMLPVGRNEFHVNVGHAGNLSGTDDTKATQWTLGYNYNLSKRTKVYAFYTKIDNSSHGNYAFLPGTPVGKDNSSLALGIRNNF